MAKKSLKGFAFERWLCKRLSRWWACDPDADDLFWRTAGSGGRATVRHKKGKKTRGHCGDIGATDADGIPLMKVVAIEAKRGYNEHSLMDVLDRADHRLPDPWEDWIGQVKVAQVRSGAFAWLLAVKRDGREPLVVVPYRLTRELQQRGGLLPIPIPHCDMKAVVDGEPVRLCCFRLEDFLSSCHPDQFRSIAEEL